MKSFTNSVWAVLLMVLLAGGAQAQPTWQWVTTQSASSTGNSQFYAPIPDGNGGLVVAGTFRGTIALGTTTLTSAGNYDGFVGRLSPAGAWTQVVSFGSTDNDYVSQIALDATGGVVVLGLFYSPALSIGATMLQNADGTGQTADVFVGRLNSVGTWTQAVRAGGSRYEGGRGVAVEANGTVVVTGEFASPSVSFGNLVLNNSGTSGSDIFVARLNPAGTWVQAVQAGGNGLDYPETMVVDASGTATVAGICAGEPGSFGTAPILNPNNSGGATPYGIFVARLNAAGSWTQAVVAGGALTNYPLNLAVDAGGNATLAGTFKSLPMRFGPFTITNNSTNRNDNDVFVARLNAAGTWTQASAAGGPGDDILWDAAIDGNGGVTAVGGFVSSTIRFGNTTLTNADASGTTSDIFLAHMNPAGTWTQALRTGGQYHDTAIGVALDGQNGVIVAGTVSNPSSTFGAITTATANVSGFAARLTGFVTATAAPTPAARFTLAPNPATGLSHLTWPGAAATPRPVQLLDGLGREVRRLLLPAHATAAPLDVAGLVPGLYLVRCEGAAARLVVE